MKLLWITELEPNQDTGAAGTVLATVTALRGIGSDVDTVWARNMRRRIRHGNLHYLLESPREILRTGIAQFEVGQYDAVVFSQPHGYRLARWLRQHHPTVPAIHRSHGVESLLSSVLRDWKVEPHGSAPLRRIAGRMLAELLKRHVTLAAQHASGHVVSATACARHLERVHRVPPGRVAVIPLAAPQDFLDAEQAGWSADRSRKLLHVGQYVPVKGGAVLAAAWNAIASDREQLTLTWVCERGSWADAAAALSPLARERTRFLPWMSRQELMAVYDAHGVFLWPSYFEGFGKAFLEAMARGLCVVSTAQGGAADLIQTGQDGYLVPVGDAPAMAREVLCLLDSARPANVSAAAAQKARKYTWQGAAEKLLAAITAWRAVGRPRML